jgi:hypothetical protein
MPAYRQYTLAHFSGTLCVGEIHLGHRTLLLATDPLGDFPVAFALVSANDQDHMRRFLHNLKSLGFLPQVVVTDGSTLYPKILAELWPQARHQLCVFHILKDINQCVFDVLRRLRRRHAQVGGRKRRRGRRRQATRARSGPTRKEQSHFIWKHRHLLVTRPEHLTGQQRRWLGRMFAYLPALRQLRDFVLQVYHLFDPALSLRQVCNRWVNLTTNTAFLADPDLGRALAMLTEEKMVKIIAYLDSPLGQRVRTNNHVERTNRRLRYLEKVLYKWRRRRTIVRFVVLALNQWRHKQAKASDTPRLRPTDYQIKQTPKHRHKTVT